MLDNDINVNCFADIVTTNGEKIPIDDSKLWANGFEVSDATSSNGTFTIGALIAGKLKIKLNNIYEDYSKYDFDKASVKAYVSKSFSDGTTEKLKIGEYRVSETSYDGSLITLTCLDNINNFNREYDSNLSYPTTSYEVVRDACIKCDVPFTMARFDNSDYVINEIPSDNQKLTYGQVIAYILQLSGLWGKCGHDGELLIGWYDMSQFDSRGYDGGTFSTKTTPYSDGDTLNGGNFTDYSSGDIADGGTFTEARNYHNIYTQKDLNVATDDVVITGVKVTVTSKEDKTKDVNALAGKEGYVVSISDNPFIPADKAQTVANYIFKKIGGMRFRPLDATLLSNPLIESGDVALVTDRKQNTYSCFISNRTFTVGSGTEISCDAENASRNSADKFSNETKAIVQARKVAQAQLSIYDKQMQLLTQLMSQSLGLFKTEQVQEDGSIIYIMHNKADLNSSNIQWKMTANGMAVSSDYGKTWNAGIDKDGNAIFNIMSAIGINFDWAHGGTLTLGGENNTNGKQYVKDANGKILITLDNKGITLADGVNISWNNISNQPSIPTKNSQLQNDSGYTTMSAVEQKNYTTMSEVEKKNYTTMAAVLEKKYQNSDQVVTITKNTVTAAFIKTLGLLVGDQIQMGPNAKITWANVTNQPSIPTDTNDLTNGAGYTTMSAVEQKNYTTMSEVEKKNYTTMAAVLEKKYQNSDQVVTITKNTVTAAFIKTLGLLVGDQIQMGPNAKITWANVTNQPSIPTDTNDLTNGAGYTTMSAVEGKNYTTMSEVEDKGYVVPEQIADFITNDDLAEYARTNFYKDLNELKNNIGYTEINNQYVISPHIYAGTVTASDFSGGTINIGNGVFKVDSDGKVTASNLNMSGGSIALNGNLSNSTIDLKATDNSGNNYELWMNGAVLRIVKNDENLITLYGTTGSIGAQTMYAQEIQSDKFREPARGTAMCGDATGHTYHCGWNGSALSFQVDTTWVWSSSDKRLKKNIEAINQDYIDAVGSVDLLQYNLNRQGYSDRPLYFGAMAQDIIENLKDKGHVNENLNMIFQNKATSDDDTLYYGMNYEQFLILRLAGDEQKIDKMQKRIDELEDKFSRLCQNLGIDESEV